MLAGSTSDYAYPSIPGTGVTPLAARTGAVLESRRGSAATVIGPS